MSILNVKHWHIKICLAVSLLTSCLPNSSLPIKQKSNSQYSIQYGIPKLNLDTFAEEKKDILFDYLTKSSEWHVFQSSGATIAVKREESKSCNPVHRGFPKSYFTGLIAHQEGKSSNSSPDIAYVLHYYTINDTESATKSTTKANDNKTVNLWLHKYTGSVSLDNSFGSKLIIESKNKKLVLNANEISEGIGRKNTTKFLSNTKKQLEKLTDYSSRGKNHESFLPLGSILLSKQSTISIQQDLHAVFSPGVYNISGYINEGEKGLVKIKVIDRSNGTKIQESGFEDGPDTEYVGWSTNPMQKFNFCLAVSLGSRHGFDNPDRVKAEFQVWFSPTNGKQERMLFSHTQIVDLWMSRK